MLVATTYPALRDPDVYERPDEFDPERYYTGDAEEKGAKNYLVFGSGRHNCIGQHYAQLNLALFIGKASLMLDWKHHATPKSEEIKVFATIFPMVSRDSREVCLDGYIDTDFEIGRLPVDVQGEEMVNEVGGRASPCLLGLETSPNAADLPHGTGQC